MEWTSGSYNGIMTCTCIDYNCAKNIFHFYFELTVDWYITRDPLLSCCILSLSSTGRPFFSHKTSGCGSPDTEHSRITFSAMVIALLPGGARISGGTVRDRQRVKF